MYSCINTQIDLSALNSKMSEKQAQISSDL